MEEIQILEALEKYLNGDLTKEEQIYFEQLRNSNAEFDQLVVENTMFLSQLNHLSDRRNLKALLNETHTNLSEKGEISNSPAKAKVVQLMVRYKKVLAMAASIAGITALAISGLVSYFSTNPKRSDIAQLKKELNAVKISQRQTINTISKNLLPSPSRPATSGKFGGTGFLIEGSGYLVTSAHVVTKADSVYISNSKGEYFKAKTVIVNDNTDIAILKIEDSRFESFQKLPYGIKKGSSELGEPIFTLGFPKSEIVYNEGYLSSKTGYNGDTIAYQLAISANPGNSGGPIFNNLGEVIGVLSGKQLTAEGVIFSSQSKNIYRLLDSLHKIEPDLSVKIKSQSALKGLDRVRQIKKIEDCIFSVMSY